MLLTNHDAIAQIKFLHGKCHDSATKTVYHNVGASRKTVFTLLKWYVSRQCEIKVTT